MSKPNLILETKYSTEEIRACIDMLEYLVQNTPELYMMPYEQKLALMKAAGQLSRPDKNESRARSKQVSRIKRQRGDIDSLA